jgi:hypothetical protein
MVLEWLYFASGQECLPLLYKLSATGFGRSGLGVRCSRSPGRFRRDRRWCRIGQFGLDLRLDQSAGHFLRQPSGFMWTVDKLNNLSCSIRDIQSNKILAVKL